MACTTDNASNNDVFMDNLEVFCKQNNVGFNRKESHIRCIGHIINLGVQACLKELKYGNADEGDSELAECDAEVTDLIPKVSFYRDNIGFDCMATTS